MADSTSIDDEVTYAKKSGAIGGVVGWKRSLLLFVIFMVACSDFFINTVLGVVPGATQGRETTNRGTVVQGVLTVLAYVVAVHAFGL